MQNVNKLIRLCFKIATYTPSVTSVSFKLRQALAVFHTTYIFATLKLLHFRFQRSAGQKALTKSERLTLYSGTNGGGGGFLLACEDFGESSFFFIIYSPSVFFF